MKKFLFDTPRSSILFIPVDAQRNIRPQPHHDSDSSTVSVKPRFYGVQLLAPHPSDFEFKVFCGVMVIVVGNGHGDTSSIPGRDWLHFTLH